MRIGILSDTHGRVPATAAAMRLLQAQGAEFFIHCGDLGSTAVINHLAGVPSAFVFGNTDWDRQELRRHAEQLNVQCLGTYGDLNLGGKRFAVTHGDDNRLTRRVLSEQLHDYLLVGHSHAREQDQVGRVLLINPGALHRAHPKTVALLDTSDSGVRFLEVAE